MTATGNVTNPPRGFGIFTSLCLVLGVVGLLGNGLFLFLNLSHGMSLRVEEGLVLFGLLALHLTRSAGYLAGWAMIRNKMSWARPLVVACAATSLLELAYNTTTAATKGTINLSPETALYFLLPLLLEGSVFWYFARRPVGAYLAGRRG